MYGGRRRSNAREVADCMFVFAQVCPVCRKSGGSVSSWKHGEYFSTAEERILQAVPGEYLAPMIHVAFISWPDRILSPD